MNKKLLIFIILSLLAINGYTLLNVYLKKRNEIPELTERDSLHTYRLNFAANIRNGNILLGNFSVKDSLGNVFPINDILQNDQKPTLVCRFSELHCESCVNFSIQLFRLYVDSIGKDNMLYLGSYRNNKIFNRIKQLYYISNQNVYNTSILHVPVEEIGYPYYFILHEDLTISNVFIPDKATPEITNSYLKMIKERYFNKANNRNR